MSEPRCRVFLALLPNIRHNCLKALGEHLSQCVKRLQGIPPPEFAVKSPKRGAAAARARALAIGQRAGSQALQTGATAEEKIKENEDEEARRRARALDNGWKEGPFFEDLDGVVGVLAGCPVSTFRR